MDQDLWNPSIFGGGDAERVESSVELAEGLASCGVLAYDVCSPDEGTGVQRWEDALRGSERRTQQV